jgi:hypothetical protein
LDGRGGLKAEPKTGNGAAVIIHNDREPGTNRWATGMAQPNIQERMIGLPDVVGLFGFASVQEVVGGPLGFAAVMGQRDQGGVQVLDDPIHPFVVGNGPFVAQRHVTHVSVDKGHRGWGGC